MTLRQLSNPRVYKLKPGEEPRETWRWRMWCPWYMESYEYSSWGEAITDACLCVKTGDDH